MKLEHVALTIFMSLAIPLTLGATADAQPKKAKASAKEPSANEVAASVQKFYDKTKTFTGGLQAAIPGQGVQQERRTARARSSSRSPAR